MNLKSMLLLASGLVLQSTIPVLANTNFSLFANKQQSAPAFLPVEDAFVFSQLQQGENLNVFWQITEGYYLYKNKLRVTINGNDYTIDGLPAGKDYHDEYFGDVEVYYEELDVEFSIKSKSASHNDSFSMTVEYQGCAESGICYPPQKKLISP